MSFKLSELGLTIEQYVDCTLKYVSGGKCVVIFKDKVLWEGKMLPDQVENLQMHQARCKTALLIDSRTLIDGDVKTITLYTGDKVYWTDGDYGTDDIVLEDLGERVVVKSKNTCGEFITLNKERVKFKGVKCLQRKVWV